MKILHIFKLMTYYIKHSVTESFTAVFSKDLRVTKNRLFTVKLKTDSTINSFTVIYRKGLKIHYTRHADSVINSFTAIYIRT